MPLDTGALQNLRRSSRAGEARRWAAPRAQLDASLGVGAALRQLREAKGLGLDDIAATTRLRASHLAAIEALDAAALPSAPFSIGYVRAYAQALDLETEAVVRRFRAEAPEAPEGRPLELAAPPRRRFSLLWLAMGAAIILAVAGWNLSRHASGASRRQALTVASGPAAQPRPQAGPLRLGAPLPAPPEAAAPPVYQTPGLAGAVDGQAKASPAPLGEPGESAVAGPAGARFIPQGAVYAIGAPPSDVILQARTPASLVVRGEGGAVYFARQLAAGEAWRAPATSNLVVDVDDPGAVEVFVGGVSRGALVASKTPLARLSK